MIRVIFILSQTSAAEREAYAHATLSGSQWVTTTPNGKQRKITDKEMVDLSQTLYGWAQSVYKFGCSFIHLSNFHNHLSSNPFRSLPQAEREAILNHMRNYHGGPLEDDPTMEVIASYLPRVFEKISDTAPGCSHFSRGGFSSLF
ncbi:MAG: hypothetical protein DWH91_15720 [Planctomycetota bacterium]|nr:MAG: hypothetical protein DWH91_15720 [Planctomycetota bacterium]